LLRVEGHLHSGEVQRLRLLQDSGLLLLESTTTRGKRRGDLFSLGTVHEVVALVMQQIRAWQESSEVDVQGYQVDPLLRQLIGFDQYT
jgi:hypothetical protein